MKLTGLRGVVLAQAAMATVMRDHALDRAILGLGNDVLAERPRAEPSRPESIPDELGYTPRQYAEDADRARRAAAKRERRKSRNLRIASRALSAESQSDANKGGV